MNTFFTKLIHKIRSHRYQENCFVRFLKRISRSVETANLSLFVSWNHSINCASYFLRLTFESFDEARTCLGYENNQSKWWVALTKGWTIVTVSLIISYRPSSTGNNVGYGKTHRGTDPRCSARLAGLLIAATHLQVYDTSIAMGTSMFQACVFTECSVITDIQFNNGD